MKQGRLEIDLHRLRDIGWSKWDPIGLLGIEGSWKGKPFEDEYDTYLLRAAGMLRNGCAQSDVVDYLFRIQTEYMGLGVPSDVSKVRTQLLKVVQAIDGDSTLWKTRRE